MTRLRVWVSRLVATVSGRRRDTELRDEIETHLELLEEQERGRGLSHEDARAAARRAFGGVEQVRQAYREQRRLPTIDALTRDVGFAARRLLVDRGSTLAAVGILALGVGSTVVMADMLDRLLLRPPSHIASPDLVRRIYTQPEGAAPYALITNYATVEHLAKGLAPEVSHVAAFTLEQIGFGRGPEADRFEAVTHSRAYFDVLGLTPRIGALPSVDRPHQPDTVVISHALWQQRFGGREDVLGRKLRLGLRVYTVVAVAPAGFTGVDTDPVDMWLPLESRAEDGLINPDWRTSTGYFMFKVLARLRHGVDVRAVMSRATAVYNAGPTVHREDGKRRSDQVLLGELAPARQPGGTDDVRVAVWVAAVSGFVLLIACGNVGNILFVRGLRRGRELAIKTALGATRLRLFRELFVEAAVLAGLASAVALFICVIGGSAVRAMLLPAGASNDTSLDVRLLAIAAVACGAATLALGLLPTWRLTARQNLAPGRMMLRERPSLLLDAFVALQVALSVPMLVGASLFALSFWHARQVDFGMTTSRVAVVSTNMVEVGEADRNHRVHREMQAKLAQLPQVEAIAAVQTAPMRGAIAHILSIPGVELGPGALPYINGVDPEFFAVMGIPIVIGRGFTDEENTSTGRPVTVITDAMARSYWPGRSALGSCIRVGTDEAPCAEIVGVAAGSSMWPGLGMGAPDATRTLYVPIERYGALTSDRALLVRTSESPTALLDLLRRQGGAAAPDLPHIRVAAFDDVFLPALRPLRLGATVFAAFSFMALLIAGAGLAAVTASGVARRTREFGIRLALGASPARLVKMVLGRSLVSALIGVTAGALLAVAGERALRSVLFGLSPGDPRAIGVAVVALAIVSAVAAWLPARRAGEVDPAVALRTE